MRNVSGHRETNATACPGDPVMGLLGSLRSAIHAELGETVSAGLAVNRAASRELTFSSGLQLSFTWTPQLPDGWTLVRYRTCFEGWSKPSGGEDITYLNGYTASDWPGQPKPLWVDQSAGATSVSFPVPQAGHYTLRVRAIVRNGAGPEVTAPYEGNATYLVKSGGKRK
jgi:hypothetical protein